MLAAAAWSKHFCCICFVVFILACSASSLACGVFGAAVNTELMYAFLRSLHWSGSLVSDLPNKHLPRPPGKWMTASKCAALSAKYLKIHCCWFQSKIGILIRNWSLAHCWWFHLGNYWICAWIILLLSYCEQHHNFSYFTGCRLRFMCLVISKAVKNDLHEGIIKECGSCSDCQCSRYQINNLQNFLHFIKLKSIQFKCN